MGRGEGGDTLLDGIADWLMDSALAADEPTELFKGVCERLYAAGIPLSRAVASYPTLHPLYRSISLVWRRGEPLGQDRHLHGRAEISEAWLKSPFAYLIEHRLNHLRRRLDGPEAMLDFPVLRELIDEGHTDYLGYAISFGLYRRSLEDVRYNRPDGVVGSWCTDRGTGFTDHEIAGLVRIQKRLAVALRVVIREQITRNVLDTYLGLDAGRQVLEGLIQRGDGATMHAVIWFSDLRNSTPMADSMSREAFLQVLNLYFECTAGAVMAAGGEVLRFIGDAVLAIFPIRDDGFTAEDACRAAVEASRDALTRIAEVNGERVAEGAEALSFGLSLHLGDVMYGNIGVPERLEFSVIGSAANEAARIEALTKSLGEPVLVSEEVARHYPEPLRSVGAHCLRGVGAPIELFAPCSGEAGGTDKTGAAA